MDKQIVQPILTSISFEPYPVLWDEIERGSNVCIAPYQKNMKNYSVNYKLNNYRFRSDNFTGNHNDMHILFGGCSVTFGEGVDQDKTWAYQVYNKIKESNNVSGYFNISFPGASITDIIMNTFKYIHKFGNPDVIFLSFPNNERDTKYVTNEYDLLNKIIFEYYMMLSEYCKSNNIKLFSFSWSHGSFKKEKQWSEEFLNNYFNNYYVVDDKEFKKNVLKYPSPNQNIVGEDDGHPGNAPHWAWYNFIYNKYLEETNDSKN
jgi:hypothetical protein